MTSAARRASNARYAASAKGKAREVRYAASEKGKARKQRNNAKRIRIGGRTVDYVSTVETARAINAHVKRRLLELEQGFACGEKTESDSAGAVPA